MSKNDLKEDIAKITTMSGGNHENIDLLYDYTKYCLDSTNASYDLIGTKLATVMEVSALLLLGLRITSSFHNLVPLNPVYFYFSYLVLKYCACVALAIAIVISMIGIYPRPSKSAISPDLLLHENFSNPNESFKLVIAKTWMQTLAEQQVKKDNRTKLYQKAIICLGIGVFFAAANTTDGFFLAILGH